MFKQRGAVMTRVRVLTGNACIVGLLDGIWSGSTALANVLRLTRTNASASVFVSTLNRQ